MKLERLYVEKPWGRTELPPIFAHDGAEKIGEIWFAAPDARDLPLLAKYIFTSERLSIQVHPDDEQARDRGLAQGKSECWYILGAEAGATIGIGLRQDMDREALRSAARDGSIEELIDWKPVRPGDFFFVPAGTVHAIGAGVSLLEFQQNTDITYRLYDYGRPRELHLDDGMAVARAEPYDMRFHRHAESGSNAVLVEAPHFTLARIEGDRELADRYRNRARWAMPVRGSVSAGGETAEPGECLFIEAEEPLTFPDDSMILLGSGRA